MLSKEVSSTIFKVFGMTQPGIELRSAGPLVNTLPTINRVQGQWTNWNQLWLKCWHWKNNSRKYHYNYKKTNMNSKRNNKKWSYNNIKTNGNGIKNGQMVLLKYKNGSWGCRVLLPLVILNGRTNELTKILRVFDSEVLLTAWDEENPCAVSRRKKKTVMNSCAGTRYSARSFEVELI